MKTFLMILSVAVICLSGCVHERVIYRDRVPNPSDEITTQEPPEVIQERIAVAPSPVHVWIGGHWGWRHGAYAWAPGYWAARPHYRSHWAPGAWSRPRSALASWSLALMQVVVKNVGLRV